ncbi:SGNH/GDSL hydrolase family protein [Flavobacterium sp.]|uniref:SGNH/GDSL hydrolase family protein n=1 Tax=Flavobacterium sp. TaxID=239 RepID=UPI0026333CD3|nr:SGNH/GDSL hydrolase family protein [Flavobacterium sp.]
MKWHPKILFLLSMGILLCSCSQEQTIPYYIDKPNDKQINYLALGDSYTIGQSVCTTCRFPEQLKACLQTVYPNNPLLLQVIAKTGWTTTNLISEINLANPSTNFDLVTLLIGVNNQYQRKPFSLYEQEFPALVNKAIMLAKGDKTNVIVVSIPDYAYTPYGQGAANISNELNQYNAFAQDYCNQNQIEFVYITDITQQGLINTALVASDGLHPSELAYAQFVERILPKAVATVQN